MVKMVWQKLVIVTLFLVIKNGGEAQNVLQGVLPILDTWKIKSSAALSNITVDVCEAQAKICEDKKYCYGNLGCFNYSRKGWCGNGRFLNPCPLSPAAIATKFLLWNKNNKGDANGKLMTADETSVKGSIFIANLPTKFIIHGYIQDRTWVRWMDNMKDALLTYGDYNVIQVEWGLGFGNKDPYFVQSAANTRVVGAQIWQLITIIKVSKLLVNNLNF